MNKTQLSLSMILLLNPIFNVHARVFLPGIVGGTTQSPREVLVMEKINLNDYGVIAFGENGFLIVKCNPNYQLPSIKNKKTTAKEMSAEFEEFVQRFWCQPEKRSNNDNRWGWDNSISNQLKNGLEVEIQKRGGKLPTLMKLGEMAVLMSTYYIICHEVSSK